MMANNKFMSNMMKNRLYEMISFSTVLQRHDDELIFLRILGNLGSVKLLSKLGYEIRDFGMASGV